MGDWKVEMTGGRCEMRTRSLELGIAKWEIKNSKNGNGKCNLGSGAGNFKPKQHRMKL